MPAPVLLLPRALPESLKGLTDLALDLRWSTTRFTDHFWARVAPDLWERTHNPYLVLQNVTEARLREVALDSGLVKDIAAAVAARNAVLDLPGWFLFQAGGRSVRGIAYFSMEYGLNESLPIYAGGLGILAGDHLKTASDLGVPLVGLGLLYAQGYFEQMLTHDGWQIEAYPYNDPVSLPVTPVMSPDGDWLRVELDLPGRTIWLRVWEAHVGRVKLYLLDSNDSRNSPWDRAITSNLYAGDNQRRLLQELVLGVGGWRVLEALKFQADVCHMNEGHAAFAVFARLLSFMHTYHVSFETALWATRAGNVFTTHTPVPAGFDRFDSWMVRRHLQPFAEQSGVSVETLVAMGLETDGDPGSSFNMAYCATRGSAFVNGVSQLHGEVSGELFSGLYPRWPFSQVPIGSVTNGVHMPSWDSAAAEDIWKTVRGDADMPDTVETVSLAFEAQTPALTEAKVSDSRLFDFRNANRKGLVDYVRRRLRLQLETQGASRDRAARAAQVLDPNALTLGFARRFATYKRPTLLLTDMERLVRLLSWPGRPVQLIVAGKAHPIDTAGKNLVQVMARAAEHPDLCDRLVFLSDYDMVLTQHLAAGVDVWLNTPRRPFEACGTSGMKVLVNG
ncbi:MAG: alpha-glucan family phosphorylase, partial [Capsulimonadaceae bacterium]